MRRLWEGLYISYIGLFIVNFLYLAFGHFLEQIRDVSEMRHDISLYRISSSPTDVAADAVMGAAECTAEQFWSDLSYVQSLTIPPWYCADWVLQVLMITLE